MIKCINYLFLAFCFVGCFSNEPTKTGLEGKPLPTFSVLLPDSITWLNTGNIPSGKVAAFILFSPHCPYCRSLTKEITQDANTLKDIQFYFITSFPFDEMKKFYSDFQLAKFPNIITGYDTSYFSSIYFNATSVPFIAIYGKDKKLNRAFIGNVSSNELKELVEQ